MSKIGNYIKQPSGYKAFIPSAFLPKGTVEWDEDLILLLSRADLAIGKLNAIDQLVPDVDYFIKSFAKKEAALSSQIEGTQATLIDVFKAEAKIFDEKSSDVDEITNYIEAMNYGIERIKKLPLSLRLIREIHERILKGVRGQHRNPGQFRSTQNWIGGPTIETAAFVPPPPHEMKSALNDLEHFIYKKENKLPTLIKAGLLHAQFETIHPFLDGNGRTGRLLITFFLYKEGILSRPLLYISDFFKQHRGDYYTKLNSYRFDAGVNDWLKYFLEGIRTVSEDAVTVAQKIRVIRERHLHEVSAFGRNAKTALRLLDQLYAYPIVDMQLVMSLTKLSKARALDLIEKFTAKDILKEITGKQRNRRFAYHEYVALFSKEKIN
jgi:Fic family protein